MDALLERRDPRLVGPDLADDPGPYPALPHPVGGLADELVGEVVDRPAIETRLGWVIGAAVPAGTHHDVQPREAGYAGEPGGIAPHAVERQVDERRAAGCAEQPQLL